MTQTIGGVAMNNMHGSAVWAAAAALTTWERLYFPLSFWGFGPSPINDGTVRTRPANRAITV